MELIAVGFGCALGAVCRYLLENGFNNWTMDPISILVINCVGCFLMGLFTAIIERREPSKAMAKFMTTGFCGGLTTFSTFSADTYKLLQTNAWQAIALVLASLFLGMLLYALGHSFRGGMHTPMLFELRRNPRQCMEEKALLFR